MLPPVLVLTAGLGTRLRPLSSLRAKPALPVAGAPLVSRILRWLAACGARDVLLNLHHRPETITAIVGDGRAFGLSVRYSWENPLLGSGGGPRRAFSLVGGDDLLVVNGDTLTDVDLSALWRTHRHSGADVTMALVPNPRPDEYGGVLVDDDGAVTGFTRRGSTPGGGHFVGVQCVRRRAFSAATDGVPCESVAGLYPSLMRERPGSVRGWTTRAAFEDIGTPASYLQTCLARAAAEGGSTIEAGAEVELGAEVEGSVLWPGALVERGAAVTSSIVAGPVVVRAGARYNRVVIVPADADASGGPASHRDAGIVTPLDGKDRRT
jgi:NDP-sugar pyrophosphorylase family protein